MGAFLGVWEEYPEPGARALATAGGVASLGNLVGAGEGEFALDLRRAASLAKHQAPLLAFGSTFLLTGCCAARSWRGPLCLRRQWVRPSPNVGSGCPASAGVPSPMLKGS